MIVDLCCGQGRFESEEEVVSIDLDPSNKPTIVADVRHLPLRPKLRPRLAHASPPCTYLSFARERWGYPPAYVAENLRIVAACFDAFAYLEPQTWTLENPKGILSRTVEPQAWAEYETNNELLHKRTAFYSNNRALARALIPQDVRQQILGIAR